MTTISPSSVGQLLFVTPPALNFARLVADLTAALPAVTETPHVLRWDHDDIAAVDLPGTRIVLGYDEGLPGGWGACLSVSVGAGPQPGTCALADRVAALARMIADRIACRHKPDETRWHEVGGVVDADALDALNATLAPVRRGAPRFAAVEALVDGTVARVDTALAQREAERAALEIRACGPRRRLRRAPPPPPPPVANDLPQIPRVACPENIALRAALYGEETAPATPQMRLAIHAMNATLMVVSLPVGAGLMTYGLLRGENLRLSARAVALIGAAIGILQSPVAPMIGI